MSAAWSLRLITFYGWAVFLGGWLRMGLGDWSEQRVRHTHLRLWGALTAAAYLALAAHSWLAAEGLGAAWWRAWAWHAGVSAFASWLLWSLRIWPAGDVKLFTLLALVAPLLSLPGDFRGGTVFLEALINTFVPAAGYLFVAAAFYLWRTRFAHQAEFLQKLGVERAGPFLWGKSREVASFMKDELGSWAKEYRESPRRLLLDASSWIAQMAVMSLVTYQIGAFVRSNVARTLICFGVFFGWSRFAAELGKGRALALTLAGFALLAWQRGGVDWRELSVLFGHISVFSLCIFFGVQLAFRAIAGNSAAMALPFLFMIPMLIPFGSLGAWLRGASLPALPSAFSGLGVWAMMGLFFGLAIVFVKMWDAESYMSVRPDQIEPYMTPGPALVARIEADERFREKHFTTFYADGLTPEQAKALRRWCERNRIDLVPLAPTISFANWIYLGYFLTCLLQGHVLKGVY